MTKMKFTNDDAIYVGTALAGSLIARVGILTPVALGLGGVEPFASRNKAYMALFSGPKDEGGATLPGGTTSNYAVSVIQGESVSLTTRNLNGVKWLVLPGQVTVSISLGDAVTVSANSDAAQGLYVAIGLLGQDTVRFEVTILPKPVVPNPGVGYGVSISPARVTTNPGVSVTVTATLSKPREMQHEVVVLAPSGWAASIAANVPVGTTSIPVSVSPFVNAQAGDQTVQVIVKDMSTGNILGMGMMTVNVTIVTGPGTGEGDPSGYTMADFSSVSGTWVIPWDYGFIPGIMASDSYLAARPGLKGFWPKWRYTAATAGAPQTPVVTVGCTLYSEYSGEYKGRIVTLRDLIDHIVTHSRSNVDLFLLGKAGQQIPALFNTGPSLLGGTVMYKYGLLYPVPDPKVGHPKDTNRTPNQLNKWLAAVINQWKGTSFHSVSGLDFAAAVITASQEQINRSVEIVLDDVVYTTQIDPNYPPQDIGSLLTTKVDDPTVPRD